MPSYATSTSIDRRYDGCIFLMVGLGKRVSVRVGWPFEPRVVWQDSKLGFGVATGRDSKRPPHLGSLDFVVCNELGRLIGIHVLLGG